MNYSNDQAEEDTLAFISDNTKVVNDVSDSIPARERQKISIDRINIELKDEDEVMRNMPNKQKALLKVTIYVLGVIQSLGFNTIFATLDHHQYYLSKLTTVPVSVLIPVCHSLPSPIANGIITFSRRRPNKELIITTCLIIMILFFIALPSVFSWGHYKLVEVIIISLIQSVGNGLFYANVSSLGSIFPKKIIGLMTTGQASAGVSINILQIIINLSLSKYPIDQRNFIGSWIIYPFAAFLYTLCLILCIILFKKNKYYIYRKNQMREGIRRRERIQRSQKISEHFIIRILRYIWPLTVAIMVGLIMTSSMFPGVFVLFNFYGLPYSFKPATITLLFNIFDTTGRIIARRKNLTKKQYYIINYSRFIIFILLFVDLYFDDRISSPYYSIFFTILAIIYGISNGMVLATYYMISPDEVEDQTLRDRTGAFCGFAYGSTSLISYPLSFATSALALYLAPSLKNIDYTK